MKIWNPWKHVLSSSNIWIGLVTFKTTLALVQSLQQDVFLIHFLSIKQKSVKKFIFKFGLFYWVNFSANCTVCTILRGGEKECVVLPFFLWRHQPLLEHRRLRTIDTWLDPNFSTAQNHDNPKRKFCKMYENLSSAKNRDTVTKYLKTCSANLPKIFGIFKKTTIECP